MPVGRSIPAEALSSGSASSSRNEYWRRHVSASHAPPRRDAALDVARMRFSTQPPVILVILCDLPQLRARQIRLIARLRSLLNLLLVQERPGDRAQPRLLEQPFAGEVVDVHTMVAGVMADQLELLEPIHFP